MLERDDIRNAVFRAIDQVKRLSLDESALSPNESMVLLGDEAALDSMGFVNFVVAVEEEMSRLTDRAGNLVETFTSQDSGAETISTVGQFIDFLYKHEL